MKKYQIWERDDHPQEEIRGGMLIPADEVKDGMVYTNQDLWNIDGADVEYAGRLNELEERKDIYDRDDLEEFLRSNGVTYTAVGCLDYYEKARSLLCFDRINHEFFDLLDCETCRIYEWHDGSNWKCEVFDDATMTATEVVAEDEVFHDFDQWDGSNSYAHGMRFYHEEAYQATEVDGEPVQDTFLLVQWSQWQGDHQTGLILTKAELDDRIANGPPSAMAY